MRSAFNYQVFWGDEQAVVVPLLKPSCCRTNPDRGRPNIGCNLAQVLEAALAQ